MLFKRRFLTAAITAGLFLLPFQASAKVFEKPDVTVENVKFASIGMGSINTIVILNIDNPNVWGLNVKKVEYKLDINDIEDVAEGTTVKEISILKETKNNIVEVPVSINGSKVLPTLSSIIKSPKNIDYSISGKVYFSTFIGDIPIPFSRKATFNNAGNVDKITKQMKALNFFNF